MMNQKKVGVVLSYMAQFVHIITCLVYVPIMLRTLGKSEYGLYQLSSATISNLSILTLGFNSAYIKFYSRFNEEKDSDGLAKLNGMFLSIFVLLSFVCLIAGVVIVVNARMVLGNELSNAEIKTSQILMMVLVLSMCVSFIASVFQSQVSAYERFVWLKALDLIGYVLNPCITLPLLLMGYGSIGVVVVTFLISACTCIANLLYTRKCLKIKYSFGQFDWSLFREMSGFTFYVFTNIVVEQINWSIDKYLLGRMCGTNAVATYSVGAQIVSIYRTLSGTIRGVFVPQINKMVACKEKLQIINALFIKLGRIIFMVSFLVYSGFLVFGKEFIAIWAGTGYERSYWCAIIPMTALIVPIIQGPGIDIQRAMNRHKARSIAYACIAVGNLFLSVFLIKLWGEVGASIGTAAALVLGQWLFMNYYYHKKIGLNMIEFWGDILKFIPGGLVIVVSGFVIKYVIYTGSIVSLLGAMTVFAFIYAVIVCFFCMNKYERSLVNTIINRIWRKKE